jgi:hypothetical protein
MRFWLIVFSLLLLIPPPIQAQTTAPPCGIVDAIDYPIDNLVPGYDDFALYRSRFGGNHTGIDIAFDRWGDPVHAAARGKITYADPLGWDTEKGVVIIEHTFPDGSIAYSLYGHMEQTDTILFPKVGLCVERGDVVGAVGWPSRGRPHLHYEWRNFLPNDGGPGYVTGNPLAGGWYNPLDFTALWRARLTPAFVTYVSFDTVASLPPVALDSGKYAIAGGDSLIGVTPPNQVVWRLGTDGVVTGLAAIPGDKVVAHTKNGQVVVLQNGRYAALWKVDGPDVPFVKIGDNLIFVTADNGLSAYDVTGKPLWTLAGNGGGRVALFAGNNKAAALSVRADDGSASWRLVSADGQLLVDEKLDMPPLAESLPDGSWMLLVGAQIKRLNGEETQPVGTVSPAPGRAAQMTVDPLGNSYIYLADPDSTLISVGREGEIRWRVTYPVKANLVPPLLAAGAGCLLYTLDADGMLNMFNAADGKLVNQLQLYAGGTQDTSPQARILRVDAAEKIQVASGFLTMMTLDGTKLGGKALADCRLG